MQTPMALRSTIAKPTDIGSGQLAAISRLFSSTVIRELARKGRSPLFARLARETSLLEYVSVTNPVYTFFEAAFALLKREGFRDEYIYKAALTHKILLGRHSLQTACMLNEFRVGECKADLVILNGTATVYEVKSERDSLQRLARQVAAYVKVFARVCVIASEDHVSTVRSIVPADVGVLCLSRRGSISTVREAAERPERTCPAAIFDCLRTQEAKMLLESRGITIPDVPNTAVHAVLRDLFVKLSARDAHEGMVKVLRKTRNLVPLSALVAQLPKSLQMAALSVPLRKTDHTRLVQAVNTQLRDALHWA